MIPEQVSDTNEELLKYAEIMATAQRKILELSVHRDALRNRDNITLGGVSKQNWETREMTEEEKKLYRLNYNWEPFDHDKFMDDWVNYRI